MRSIVWIMAGFALYFVARLLEGFGDAMPFAAEGPSWDRAAFHGGGIVVLLTGLACFVRAIVVIWRAARGSKAEARKVARVFDDGEAPRDFDPDAALARYLEKRTVPAAESNRPAPTPGGGFGRRGL